jgi:PAS domain S-box-containing protein
VSDIPAADQSVDPLAHSLRHGKITTDSAHAYAEHIISTVREPLVVLDQELRVESVNRAFYHTFGVTPADTIGRLLYDLGNRQWDIPELRGLLEEILPQNQTIEDFLVEWDFEHVGRRIMLLNARRMPSTMHGRIVLAIEDITVRKRAEEALRESTATKTNSWQCSPTSSETRSHLSSCRSRCCVEPGAAKGSIRKAVRAELLNRLRHSTTQAIRSNMR